MKQTWRFLILTALAVSFLVVAAASWHSVEEIHYLKTFYPGQFTVEEVFHASGVELIKVILIILPLILVLGAGLYWLVHTKKDAH